MRPVFLLALFAFLPASLLACAPTATAPAASAPTLQTQIYEGSGAGTFTRAQYRVVLSVNEASGEVSGVFYNKGAGDNYSVSGKFIRTLLGGDYDLTLSQNANVSQEASASAGASALGRSVGAGAGAQASAAFGRSAALTGSVVGKTFTGRLRTVLANYEVKLTRVE